MNAQSAEKKVAAAGREITVAKANSWLGSKDACFRAGVDPAKMWACSSYNPNQGCIHEPTGFYRTLAELVEDQISIAENNDAAREFFYGKEA